MINRQRMVKQLPKLQLKSIKKKLIRMLSLMAFTAMQPTSLKKSVQHSKLQLLAQDVGRLKSALEL